MHGHHEIVGAARLLFPPSECRCGSKGHDEGGYGSQSNQWGRALPRISLPPGNDGRSSGDDPGNGERCKR